MIDANASVNGADTTGPSPASTSHLAMGLVGWLLLCFAASSTAVFVSTDGWYAGLHKPSWNPPAWIFAPVWTLLYIMMAIAAWLVWRTGGRRVQRRALNWFLVQWLLNALWTPLFFGMHLPALAHVDIVLLWLSLAITTMLFWKVSVPASVLLMPYLAWVSFAAVLNFTIWWMNS